LPPNAPVPASATLAAIAVEAPTQPEIPAPIERAANNAKAPPRRASSAAPSTTAQTTGPQSSGSVQVMTKNGRAEVYVNARLMGITPLTLDLPAGHVALTLKPISGGEARSVTVAIQPGAMSFITVPLVSATPTSTATPPATPAPVEN
jgi:hypothetical protein